MSEALSPSSSWKAHDRWYQSTKQHGITFHKTVILISKSNMYHSYGKIPDGTIIKSHSRQRLKQQTDFIKLDMGTFELGPNPNITPFYIFPPLIITRQWLHEVGLDSTMPLNLVLKFVVPVANSLYIKYMQTIHRNAGGAKCLVFDLMALITIIMNCWI
jgi:hypothetical protein